MTNQHPMTKQNASSSTFAYSFGKVLGFWLYTLLSSSVLALIVWLIFKYLIQYPIAWSVVFGFYLVLDITISAIKATWKHNA